MDQAIGRIYVNDPTHALPVTSITNCQKLNSTPITLPPFPDTHAMAQSDVIVWPKGL